MTQNSADSLVLDPRQVATGSPAGNSLENINTNVLGDGALCYVETGAGQGEWQLQKTSTLPAGLNVVVPTAGPGRWLFKIPPVPYTPPGNPPGEALDLWVNGDTGTAEGPGTEAEPYATTEQALNRIGYWVLQRCVIHLDGSLPHDLNAFMAPRIIARDLVVIGESGFEEISPAVLIDSQVGTLITCTSAAPGWTVDAFVGYRAELINPDSTILGYGAIAKNSATTITICAPKSLNLAAGSSVRIVSPATILDQGTPNNDASLFGGLTQNRLGLRPYGTCWVNVRMVAQIVSPYLSFWGSHTLVGVEVRGQSSVGAFLVTQQNTQLYSGKFNTDLADLGYDASYCVGNGLTAPNPGATMRHGAINMRGGAFEGSVVVGFFSFQHNEPAFVTLTDGFRISNSSGNAFFDTTRGGYIGIAPVASAGNGVPYQGMGYTGRETFQLDGTRLELGGAIEDYSSARMVNANKQAACTFNNATFTFPNGGGQLLATRDAFIDLRGNTYANLGAATAGSVNALTRAAAVWNVGDAVVVPATALAARPVDGAPNIFRSA